MYRRELKYLISYEQYLMIRQKLKHLLHVDTHAVHRQDYTITSLYFDDMYMSAYQDKLDGLKNRYKYRLRIYNDDYSLIKLEKKIKSSHYIKKEQMRLTELELDDLYCGKCDFLKQNKKLGLEFYYNYHSKLLRPKILVLYEREAYIHKVSNIRITFDKNLRYTRNYEKLKGFNEKRVFKNNEIILEIKYDHIFPSYLKKLLMSEDLEEQSISKYTLSIDGGVEYVD